MLGVLFLVGATFGQAAKKNPANSTPPAITAPGDERYTPTRIEWATLWLQASLGASYSPDSPVSVSFVEGPDGKTIFCLIQYPPDTPAQVVNLSRNSVRKGFAAFVQIHKWDWLQLTFDESLLPTSR